MSRDVNLLIGPKLISWKNAFPDVLGLLFESENYETHYNEEEGWRQHKFVATCGEVIDRLNGHNITLNTLRRLYFLYYRFNLSEYRQILQYKCDSYLRAKYDKPVDFRFVERMVDHLLGMYFDQLSEDQEYQTVMARFGDWVFISDGQPEAHEPILDFTGEYYFNTVDYNRNQLIEFIRRDPYTPYMEAGSLSLTDHPSRSYSRCRQVSRYRIHACLVVLVIMKMLRFTGSFLFVFLGTKPVTN